MYGLISLLVPLLIVAGIVYGVVRLARGRAPRTSSQLDGGSTRRLFVYTMLFITLLVAATGLQGLLGRVLSDAAVRSDSEIATTLALTLVGIPVFLTLARSTWRRLTEYPDERNALGWSLYLAGTLITALAVASVAFIDLLNRLIDGSGFDGRIFSMVLVWTSIWAVHWYAWRIAPPTRAESLQLFLGSALGLGLMAGGFATALADFATLWFDRSTAVAVGVDGADIAAATIIGFTGIAVWTWHWLRHGVALQRTRLWLSYVMLYGVLGGLTAALIGAGRSLFLLLEWLAGDPETTSALLHFRDLGPAAAWALVGIAVWRYHATLVGPAAGRARTDVDRTYDAIVAATSLVAVAGALSVLVVALFQLADPGAASSRDGGGDVLLGAFTLLTVGGPLWGLTWSRMQRHARGGPDEAASTPRRTYLFGLLGVSGVVAFGALIALLIVLFETWLDERTGSLSADLQWPVALLITSGAVAGYHFVVARAERDARVEIPRRDVLLVWSGNGEASEIASLTHADVRILRRTDETDDPVDVASIAAAIDDATGTHLLVIAGHDDVIVVPYE
jgi:hypothetical protein